MLLLGVRGQGQLATATEGPPRSAASPPPRALLGPSLHARGHRCAHLQKTVLIRRDAAETHAQANS